MHLGFCDRQWSDATGSHGCRCAVFLPPIPVDQVEEGETPQYNTRQRRAETHCIPALRSWRLPWIQQGEEAKAAEPDAPGQDQEKRGTHVVMTKKKTRGR